MPAEPICFPWPEDPCSSVDPRRAEFTDADAAFRCLHDSGEATPLSREQLAGYMLAQRAKSRASERDAICAWLRGPLLLAVGKGFAAMDPGLPMANAKAMLEKLAEQIERGEHHLA